MMTGIRWAYQLRDGHPTLLPLGQVGRSTWDDHVDALAVHYPSWSFA